MDRSHIEQRTVVDLRRACPVTDQVFFNGSVSGDTIQHTVLRHQRDMLLTALSLVQADDVLAVYGDGSRIGMIKAEKHVYQLFLAVSFHAGDSEDLTFTQGEGDLVQHLLAPFVDVFHVPYAQDFIRRLRFFFFHFQDNITADHQPGDLLRRNTRRLINTHGPAAAKDGHAVRDIHDLIQLMRNKDKGIALFFQFFQFVKQVLDLLCRQNGRRLVQDQDLRPTDQSLQDLHLLFHTDRDIHNFGVCVHGKVEFLRVFLRDRHCLLVIDHDARFRRSHAQHHVLSHGQARHQHEMLMDHADPLADSHGRRRQMDRLSVDQDLAGGRLFQTEQHLHQRGFPSAVLSHQCMDLTYFDIKVNILVRHGTVGIDLCDRFHLNSILTHLMNHLVLSLNDNK